MAVERLYLDYTVFLGMNGAAEPVRQACKSLVAARLLLQRPLFMTWEHVGRCDDVIWGYSRQLQDQYYPFMDALHSLPTWRREGYQESTLRRAAFDHQLQELPVFHRLLVAAALEHEGVIYTLDGGLLARGDLPVRTPPPVVREQAFPGDLEAPYRRSLELRIAALPPPGPLPLEAA
jgi:hypothetical protein